MQVSYVTTIYLDAVPTVNHKLVTNVIQNLTFATVCVGMGLLTQERNAITLYQAVPLIARQTLGISANKRQMFAHSSAKMES